MQRDDLMGALEHARALDPASDAAQSAITSLWQAAGPTGQVVKNALHGTWLGHALHPAVTDVPVGAWTVSLVLDAAEALAGRADLAPGADAALTIGLAGAAGAALTGLTDWSDTDGAPRRVGLVHGLLNLGAAALYAASLRERRRGRRGRGRALALLGYAGVLGSAYLGGHLVQALRIGVTHADVDTDTGAYTPVAALSDLAEATPRRAVANGVPLVLVRRGGQVYALAETCSHLGGPLAEGQVDENCITCPWHGSRFALDSGRVVDGPATIPQPRFQVRVRDGQVEVRVPAPATPDQEALPVPSPSTLPSAPPAATDGPAAAGDDWRHLAEAHDRAT